MSQMLAALGVLVLAGRMAIDLITPEATSHLAMSLIPAELSSSEGEHVACVNSTSKR